MRGIARGGGGSEVGSDPMKTQPNIVAFRCAGSSTERGRSEAALERESPPERPILPIHDIPVPCSGRLQPEHFLKAFEAGADLVIVLTCGDGDCRYLEGRRRVQQRIDYVRGLLDEVGLGGERLVVLESPAGASGKPEPTQQPDMMHEALAAALVGLAPNPLGRSSDDRVD
jgi:F420-non-reducing hydrogenase iron-sulfur subunit